MRQATYLLSRVVLTSLLVGQCMPVSFSEEVITTPNDIAMPEVTLGRKDGPKTAQVFPPRSQPAIPVLLQIPTDSKDTSQPVSKAADPSVTVIKPTDPATITPQNQPEVIKSTMPTVYQPEIAFDTALITRETFADLLLKTFPEIRNLPIRMVPPTKDLVNSEDPMTILWLRGFWMVKHGATQTDTVSKLEAMAAMGRMLGNPLPLVKANQALKPYPDALHYRGTARRYFARSLSAGIGKDVAGALNQPLSNSQIVTLMKATTDEKQRLTSAPPSSVPKAAATITPVQTVVTTASALTTVDPVEGQQKSPSSETIASQPSPKPVIRYHRNRHGRYRQVVYQPRPKATETIAKVMSASSAVAEAHSPVDAKNTMPSQAMLAQAVTAPAQVARSGKAGRLKPAIIHQPPVNLVTMPVTFVHTLDANSVNIGEYFQLKTQAPLMVDGQFFPVDTMVAGRVIAVTPSNGKQAGQLQLAITGLVGPGGQLAQFIRPDTWAQAHVAQLQGTTITDVINASGPGNTLINSRNYRPNLAELVILPVKQNNQSPLSLKSTSVVLMLTATGQAFQRIEENRPIAVTFAQLIP